MEGKARLIAVAAVVAVAAGCKLIPSRNAHEVQTGRVTKLLALWSESALRKDGMPIAQGIACKVYLYGPDSQSPVAAPGSFRFFARSSDPSDQPPEREWSFSKDQTANGFARDVLGWGYKFFLPWGEPQDKDRSCVIAVEFKPDDGSGRSVFSDQALVTIPAVKQDGQPRQQVQQFRTVTAGQPQLGVPQDDSGASLATGAINDGSKGSRSAP